MVIRIGWALIVGALLTLGCAGPTLENKRAAALPAVAALQEGRFDRAAEMARERIDKDAANPYSRLVRAIVHYKKINHQLALDGRTLIAGLAAGALNQKYLTATLSDAEAELAAVEADLAAAAEQPGISLELCLACWEIDWNGNGRVDQRDRLLLQIEQDERGEPIAEDDDRRKPTFRFDDGDIAWARAFVSFERAALDVVLAYEVGDVSRLLESRRGEPETIVLGLVKPERIGQARQRILEGLEHSDAARRAYLAETDDDREWVPSPRQKSHPMPLPVDQALYETWAGVLGDLRRLVSGEEGLSVAGLLALAEEREPAQVRGYLDLGRMLARPKDISVNLGALKRLERGRVSDAALSGVFGEYYVPEMKPSPLLGRLSRVKDEIDRNEEGFERKLRYLFWLN